MQGFQRLLPSLLVALVEFGIFLGLGWSRQKGVRRWGRRSDRANSGVVLSSSVRWAVLTLGAIVVFIVVVPTFNPGDIIAGLGIGSIAIGFAFKDFLQN